MGFSFHLSWDLAPPAREVAVTLEVLEPPSVDRLYFWAVQASFLDGAGTSDSTAPYWQGCQNMLASASG